jgi:hypothetical protein
LSSVRDDPPAGIGRPKTRRAPNLVRSTVAGQGTDLSGRPLT